MTRRQEVVRQDIRKMADKRLSSSVDFQIGPTSAVNSVKACRQRPQVQFYGNGTHRNARVSCPGRGWQFYIPITMEEMHSIVIAAHDLRAGKALKHSDLKIVSESDSQGSDLAHSVKSVIGETLKAPISRGTPISLRSLQGATRVHSGQNVTVRVQSGNVEIKTTAVALQNGRVGQSILVKNPSSGKRYRVTVSSTGGAFYNLGP